VNCAEVREHLAAYQGPSGEPPDASVERHLATCSGCRAELARYRELSRHLASLAEDPMEPPPWLLASLIETVSNRARSRLARGRRTLRAPQLAHPKIAVAGGVVVAGVAGALAIRARRRRQRASLRQRLRAAAARA
jgi:predicted anti-sigma-YlaC factor YlaD